MKIFVINLDKNTERMRFIDAQLKKLSAEYERVPAVYGAELSRNERKEKFAAFHSFLAMGFKMRPGEIGCSLSHVNIYNKMIDADIKYALILEDDVKINSNIIYVLENVEHYLDARKPQVFILSSYGVAQRQNDGIERIQSAMCTDGYVVTLEGAKLISKHNYPVVVVADRWSRFVKRYGLELYRVWPTVVEQQQMDFISDISFPLKKGFKTTLFYKIVRKCFRALSWTGDWVWYKFGN